MQSSPGKELLAQLKNNCNPAAVLPVLKQLSAIPLARAGFIKEYHAQLLFLKAFPCSKTVLNVVTGELRRISSAVENAGPSLYAAVCGDGIANTEIICNYSLELTNWLSKKFPSAVKMHSSGADAETVRKILQLLCPFVEFEKTTQQDLSLQQRITFITGNKDPVTQLHWLLDTFSGSTMHTAVKDELFRQLQVFVQWKPTPEYSRTFLQPGTGKIFFPKTFIKNVDSRHIINQKIKPPVQLSTIRQQALCSCIKISLALLCRETDPVTYADETLMEFFDMGRGFNIALVYMRKEKRLSLESYIGYMAFKNGVPVSYGGGWIFGNRCKIGVNIYPAFRRGESAWMFCQVLRLYHQYFKVSGFTVSPYQFGKGNPEGLKSGAFWFYYRLGFRPVNETIQALAKTEWEKISLDKKYRSPLQVLRKFTGCPVVLHYPGASPVTKSAADISSAISNYINQYCNGNRKQAVSAGFKKCKKETGLHSSNETLALLYLLLNEKTAVTQKDKMEMNRLFLLKENSNEKDFIFSQQTSKGFKKLMTSIEIF